MDNESLAASSTIPSERLNRKERKGILNISAGQAIGRASSRSLAVIDADESLGQLLPIKELMESYKEMPWLHNLIKDIVSPKVHLRVW